MLTMTPSFVLKAKLILPTKYIICKCYTQSVESNKILTDYASNIETSLLRVSIIGAPNAGKSTLINSLINSQICPTSKKVHTTRKLSKAITTEGLTQIVFMDTPGLVSRKEVKRYNLEKMFLQDSFLCLKDADIIGVIHDVSNSYTRDNLYSKILKILENNKHLPSFLVLNKIDLLKSKRKLLDITKMLTGNCLNGKSFTNELNYIKQAQWQHFSEIFMISALNNDGIQDLKDYLLRTAYRSPWMYDSNIQTDQSKEDIIANTVKATLLDFLPQEIPYKLSTLIEHFDIDEDGCIQSVVLVKCPSSRIQKLIVGMSDGRLKQITAVAKCTLIKAFHCNVSLKIVTTV